MMSQSVRWLAALGATVTVLGISIWLSGAYLLPLWIKSGSDRWGIASGIGVAMAAFAALWGSTFAQGERTRESSNTSEPDKHSQSPPKRETHMKAKADDSSRIYQAGRDQTINDR
jgi:hypothetical protein